MRKPINTFGNAWERPCLGVCYHTACYPTMLHVTLPYCRQPSAPRVDALERARTRGHSQYTAALRSFSRPPRRTSSHSVTLLVWNAQLRAHTDVRAHTLTNSPLPPSLIPPHTRARAQLLRTPIATAHRRIVQKTPWRRPIGGAGRESRRHRHVGRSNCSRA